MTYTTLESHAYDNVIVTNYFRTTTNFSHTYVRTYSDLSNPVDFTLIMTKPKQKCRKGVPKKDKLDHFTQWAITCSKLTIETLEQGVKYVQS